MSEVHDVLLNHSDFHLLGVATKTVQILCNVFGVSHTTLTNNSKVASGVEIFFYVKWSLAFGGSIASSDKKFSFKLYFLFIHRLTYRVLLGTYRYVIIV